MGLNQAREMKSLKTEVIPPPYCVSLSIKGQCKVKEAFSELVEGWDSELSIMYHKNIKNLTIDHIYSWSTEGSDSNSGIHQNFALMYAR